jgi:hypothetical protein
VCSELHPAVFRPAWFDIHQSLSAEERDGQSLDSRSINNVGVRRHRVSLCGVDNPRDSGRWEMVTALPLNGTRGKRWGVSGNQFASEGDEMSALEKQVGGSHYQDMAIQPIEFIMENQLDFIQGNIIKYAVRYKNKGQPVDDLRKIIHYAELALSRELS